MSSTLLAIILLVLMALVYQFGLLRSKQQAAGVARTAVHSRPAYHATWLALCCVVPALVLLLLWSLLEPMAIEAWVLADWPEITDSNDTTAQVLLMRRLEALSSGQGLLGEVSALEQAAAQQLGQLRLYSGLAKTALVALVSMTGLFWALGRLSASFAARHQVERIIRGLLLACSTIAVLTTIGIVLSMVSEALNFFSFISPADFFFGTRWNPAFSSTGAGHGEYGLLPLLWGTFMVSLIAMLVAIPLGLMTAI